MTWSAQQYARFEDERTRPVRDLVAAIPRDDARTAIDQGCDPGNSTEVLAARYPMAAVRGLDSSDDMIRAARARLPNIDFDIADIADWRASARVDVILANASLQWLPDHATLYPRLIARWPRADAWPCRRRTTWPNPRTASPANSPRRRRGPPGSRTCPTPDRHDAEWYYALLKPLCTRVDLWRTTYFHPLHGHDAIVEWFKGSALRPYLALLDVEEQQAFLDAYRRGIAAAYPLLADGTVLLPFPRLFVVAMR